MTPTEITALVVALTALVAALPALVTALRHSAEIAAVQKAVDGVSTANADLSRQLGEKTGELAGRDYAPTVQPPAS